MLLNTRVRNALVAVALSLVLLVVTLATFAGQAQAHSAIPHSCQTAQMSAHMQGNSPRIILDVFYLQVNYQQSGSYKIYDTNANFFIDVNSGRWGYYGNTTRYGVSTLWLLNPVNLYHFWHDSWVLFDGGGC